MGKYHLASRDMYMEPFDFMSLQSEHIQYTQCVYISFVSLTLRTDLLILLFRGLIDFAHAFWDYDSYESFNLTCKFYRLIRHYIWQPIALSNISHDFILSELWCAFKSPNFYSGQWQLAFIYDHTSDHIWTHTFYPGWVLNSCRSLYSILVSWITGARHYTLLLCHCNCGTISA